MFGVSKRTIRKGDDDKEEGGDERGQRRGPHRR